MSNSNSARQERTFTFVDYDINRRGVTDTARAHLMKDRVRTKREARSEWVSRNHFSPLRWMRPKEEIPDMLDADTPAPRRAHSSESERPTTSSVAYYSAVIDFQNENGHSARPSSLDQSNALSTNARYATKARSLDRHEGVLTAELLGHAARRSSGNLGNRLDSPRVEGLTSIIDDGRLWVDTGAIEDDIGRLPTDAKSRRNSLENDSEFGLSSLEGLKLGNTPPQQRSIPQRLATGTIGARVGELLPELEAAVERIPVHLLPTDRNLVRYFAINSGSLLGLDKFPGIEATYDPVARFFLPFASSNQWCFETMVLLHSAHHQQKHLPINERRTLYAENHYLAARQNVILAKTRARISALANHGDSNDDDVVAFLFLALTEYCSGNREIGRMHFQAWRDYCEMRRLFGAKPCGLLCKTVVWWCVSILVEDDVVLDSIINPSTKALIREDPAKLFRYSIKSSEFEPSDAGMADLPARLSRRPTS